MAEKFVRYKVIPQEKFPGQFLHIFNLILEAKISLSGLASLMALLKYDCVGQDRKVSSTITWNAFVLFQMLVVLKRFIS